MSPKRLGALLLGLLALTSVVALQTVGVVLVVAMLIIPGATAYLLTDRFSRMLVIAPVISVVCSVAGIYLSYYLDTASGAWWSSPRVWCSARYIYSVRGRG